MSKNLTRDEALAVALHHAAVGIPVGPCGLQYDTDKGKVNKRPLCRNGFKDFTTNPDELAALFATPTWDGPWAVGGLPGPAGYLVVDIDTLDDLARFETYDFPATYTVQTASGGVHKWYRKPDDQPVGNTTTLHGVDCIRSDNGFVIMSGTTSQWGTWDTFDELDDIITAPVELWNSIEKKTGGGISTTANNTHLTGLDRVVTHLTNTGRHQDLDALTLLVDRYQGHSPFLRGDTVYITRPGKAAGISATIGHIGPGIVKVFTGNWPPFESDHRYIVSGDQLVDENDLTWIVTPTTTDIPDDLILDVIDFSRLHERTDDIVDGVISPGRWTAIVAPAKQGKTTFIMAMAVNCSVGIDPFTGATQPPVTVLYLDCEMGRLDLEERIFDLGFEPTDLDRFYAVDIVPLMDTPDGARRVIATALHYHADIVVIDGLNGGLMGDENDNTALRNFFDLTVRPLKSRNVAVVTGDNTGKDVAKGPRGSSVKLDKPDAVLRLARTDQGVRVSAVVARSSSFIREETYAIEGLEGDVPVRYRKERTSWPDGTIKAAQLFDRLGVPLDWSRRRIRQYLRDHGADGFRNDVITAAQKYRSKQTSEDQIRRLVETVNDTV